MSEASEQRLKTPDVALERARMMLERARWGAAKLQKMDRAAIMATLQATDRWVRGQL